jgi:hypothetical protein
MKCLCLIIHQTMENVQRNTRITKQRQLQTSRQSMPDTPHINAHQ